MSQTAPFVGSRVESVFHPSDFSEASEIAFVHALKVALVTKSKLTMMHVTTDSQQDWHEFPGVRETLERWKLIREGGAKGAVVTLGIDVRKITASSRDPVKACLGFLDRPPADLIVLAVHQGDGR